MTILPTKKSSQQKNEGDGSDPNAYHGDRHSHSNHPSENYNFQNRNSPPRWSNTNSREEKRPAHPPGSNFDEFDNVDGGPTHSKRRHRASPHRSLRKTHNHSHSHLGHGHRSTGVVPNFSNPSTSQGNSSPVAERPGNAVAENDDPSGYNSGDEYDKPPELWTPEEYQEREYHFEKKLRKKGLMIKNMGEDGACLFRAVADQVYGDQEMHHALRKLCMDYMAKNSDYYSQYVTEDFEKYVERKRCDHIHGNHIEMQALSEMFNRPIEVYHYSAEPINIFHGMQKSDNEPIRLSYHRNVHYNSIVDPFKATVGVGLGLPAFKPGLADKTLVKDALRASEQLELERAMLEDKLRATDWEATNEALEEQVARESYLHWLRDNEMRSRKKARSATATSSSSLSSDGGGGNSPAGAAGGRSSPRSSPRSRTSPRTAHAVDESGSASPGQKGFSPKAGSSGLSGTSSHGDEATSGVLREQATGTTVVGHAEESFPLVETASFLNNLPPAMFGLSDWDDSDILAQVLAQSQQEYLDSLKRSTASQGSPSASTTSMQATQSSSVPGSSSTFSCPGASTAGASS
ncbi:OTU domain-containing protein 5-B-like [Ornithodoros turicata]|uniref:ubiquitinyl hydrolase 1 n=1 Tax=Ornithodoros turicata TaxID=34597 RepID=A0A2R5LG04_9ACAR